MILLGENNYKSDLEHERRLSTTEEAVRGIYENIKDIKEAQKTIFVISAKLNLLTSEYQNLNQNVHRISADIQQIKERPSKNWDTLTNTIIVCVVSASIGYGVSKIFQ